MIYTFKPGCHLSGSAQAVGERLAALDAAGALTPTAVVADARDASSPLHQHFEWDDSKAADRYRVDQAAHLIRSVTVVVDPQQNDEPKVVRAFVPVEADGRKYVPMARALGDSDMRRQVLAQAHSELGAIARKYRELRELSEVVGAIERVGQLLESSKGQPA